MLHQLISDYQAGNISKIALSRSLKEQSIITELDATVDMNIPTIAKFYIVLNSTPMSDIQCTEPSSSPKRFRSLSKGFMTYCGNQGTCVCNRRNAVHKRSSKSRSEKDAIVSKRKQTNMLRYGTDFACQLDEVKERTKQTCIARYGHVSPMMNKEVHHRSKKTCMANHGVEFPQQKFSLREKSHQTCMANHGVKHPVQSDQIKKRIMDTNLEKYGDSNPMGNNDVVERMRQTVHSSEAYALLQNIDLMKELLSEFGIHKVIDDYGISYTTIMAYAKEHGLHILPTFKTEKKIFEFLDGLSIRMEQNNRTLIAPLELDYYMPDYNIAIEVCGLYWHSEQAGRKDRNYHKTKLDRCNALGIRLITIFEDELVSKWDVVKMRLTHILHKQSSRIHARKCQIKEIDAVKAREFCEKYHIQGYVNSSVKLGAFHGDELVSVMTFGKRRRSMGAATSVSSNTEYELYRFCTTTHVIPGIASKMFKYFVREYTPDTVISYCDLRWGTGALYRQLGFELLSISKPNYWYMKGYRTREYRFGYRKDVLVKEGFNPDLSEREIMRERGYDRIWDCGTSVWCYSP